MTWILLALAWLFAGVTALAACSLEFEELLAAGAALGPLGAGTCIWLMASVWGLHGTTIVHGTIFFTFFAVAIGARGLWSRLWTVWPRRWCWLRRSTALGVVLGVVLALLHLRMLQEHDGLWFLGMGVYTDLPQHTAFTVMLSQGGTFPPQHPFYAGAPFSYHLLIDLCSGCLLMGGGTLSTAIVGMDAAYSLCFAILLWHLARRCHLTPLARDASVTLALSSSGLAAWLLLATDPSAFLNGGVDDMPGFYWGNLLCDFLLHARTVGPALCVAITSFNLLLSVSEQPESPSTRRNMAAAALCSAVLPLLNVHVFVGTTVVQAVYLSYWRPPRCMTFVTVWALSAGSLGALVWLRAVPIETEHWMNGWMGSAWSPLFWLRNVGVVLVLGLAGSWSLGRRVQSLMVGAWLVWGIGNVVILTSDWANQKLMLVWFLILCLGAAAVLERLASRGWRGKTAGGVLLLACTMGGLYGAWQMTSRSVALMNVSQLRIAQWLHNNTPPGTVVLCDDLDAFAVLLVGHRPLYVGHVGMMAAHGIDGRKRDELRREFFEGKLTHVDALRASQIDYIVRGPRSSRDTVRVIGALQCELRLADGDYEIYAMPRNRQPR